MSSKEYPVPCPWCRLDPEAIICRDSKTGKALYAYGCRNLKWCPVRPIPGKYHESDAEALQAWNSLQTTTAMCDAERFLRYGGRLNACVE